MEYPSNAHSKKPAPEPKKEPKKIEQVTTSEVIRKKPGLGKRFQQIFIGGDASSVWEYVAYDVLLPAAKDMVSDAVSTGIERMLFGEGKSPSRRGRGTSYATGHTNYGGYSKPGSSVSRYGKEEPRQMSRRARAAHNFDEIFLATRAEAEEVITRLFDLVDRYDSASVSDLYELVGITGDFTDEKYGWVDLRGAGVTRSREGYLLNLPKPEPLD